MFDLDEVPTETSALSSQVAAALDFYGSNDDHKYCYMGIIFFNTLEHLQKENDILVPSTFSLSC